MSPDERGFTVIELLLAVTLSTVVVGALGASIIAYLRTAEATANRLAETPQIQTMAARFANDVHGASSVVVSGAPACSIPAGSTLLVGVASTDHGASAGATADDVSLGVSYSYRTVSTATQRQIVVERSECRGSAIPTATTALVNSGNPGLPPTVACQPASCGSGARVDLSFHVCTANASGTCTDDDLDTTLTGQRRL